MGIISTIEEHVSTLLGFGLASASSVLATASSVVLTVVGDEDPSGNEALDASEIFGHAPLMYRPKDPTTSSPAGQLECLFLRDGDERVVFATKDRRWQIEPVKGECIVSAIGKDGTLQAHVKLKPDGTIVLVGDTIKLGSDGTTKHVAFREDVESALSSMRTNLNSHTHSAGTFTAGATPVTNISGTPNSVLADPGDLGSDKVEVE